MNRKNFRSAPSTAYLSFPNHKFIDVLLHLYRYSAYIISKWTFDSSMKWHDNDMKSLAEFNCFFFALDHNEDLDLQVVESYSDGLCLYLLDMLCAAKGVWNNCLDAVAVSWIRKTSSRSIYSEMKSLYLLVKII